MTTFVNSRSQGTIQLHEKLGEGSFSEVRKCSVNKTEYFALKRNKPSVDNQELTREYHILRYLHNIDPSGSPPYIIGLYDKVGLCQLNRNGKFGLALALYESSLDKCIYSEDNSLGLDHVQYMGAQLVEALCFLKKHRIIHADLKSSNIFVNRDCTVVIGDFGSASFADEAHQIDGELQTLWYRAPENILKQGRNKGAPLTSAIDVWSLGAILGELYIQKYCFASQINNESAMIYQHEQTLEKLYPQDFVQQAGSYGEKIYQRRLAYNHPVISLTNELAIVALKKRDSKEGKKNVALSSFEDLLDSIFVYNPLGRITAEQMRRHSFFAGNRPAEGVTPQDGIPQTNGNMSYSSRTLQNEGLQLGTFQIRCQDRITNKETDHIANVFKIGDQLTGLLHEDFILNYLRTEGEHNNHIIKKEEIFIEMIENKQCGVLVYESDCTMRFKDLYGKEGRSLTLLQVNDYIAQLIEAIKFLAKKKTVHANLTPKTILVSPRGMLKVAFFTHAFFEEEIFPSIRLSESIVPNRYSAPEIVQRGTITCAADMYSVGFVIRKVYAKTIPSASSCVNLPVEITADASSFQIDQERSDYLLSLTAVMVKENPKDRITAEELDHYQPANLIDNAHQPFSSTKALNVHSCSVM